MGVVYLAEQEQPIRRRVALKVIKLGMDSQEVIARFESERQALALMNHPNIARVFDAGTTDAGRPFFVMEHVAGIPITDYCDKNRLDASERLKLFSQVCQAVQHAHQKGIIHRDIKPSNVLVSIEDDQPRPKVIDFGVAKAIDQRLTERSLFTRQGMLVGTPGYMSPEQAEPTALDIDTRTDIYSLGVLLYELMVGALPFDPQRLRSAGYAEMQRIIREEEPPKPSTRVRALGETAPSVADRRHTDALALQRLLRGDLDWIALKALEKDRARRYQTATELATDVQKHLRHEPISASPPSRIYRLSKFVRRHRVGVAASGFVVASLIAGLCLALWQAHAARVEKARAEKRFAQVRKLANSFLFDFHDAIRDLPGSTPARALVVKTALEYLDSLAKESSDDPSLIRELAAAYRKVGDVQGNPFQPNLGDVAGARTSYRKAIALLEPLVSASGASDEDRAALATVYLTGSGIELGAGDEKGAVAMSQKGLELRKTLAQSHPDSKRRGDLATAWQFFAYHLSAAGRDAEASDALREQAAILRELLATSPTDPVLRHGLGRNRYLAAIALDKRGDVAAAKRTFLEAIGLEKDLLAGDPGNTAFRRDLAYTLTDLANLLGRSGEPRAALERHREALAISQSMAEADPKSVDPQIAIGISEGNIGRALVGLHEPGEGLRHLSAAVSVFESVVKTNPSNAWAEGMLAGDYADLADVYAGQTDPRSLGSACALYRKSVATFGRLKAAGRLHRYKEAVFESARVHLAACEARLAASSVRGHVR
jgi:tetratricopeptide (TPR) repeat protein